MGGSPQNRRMKSVAVIAELHIFDGEADWKRPVRLQIRYGGGPALRLLGAGDGEGLVVDRLPLEPPVDMGEYGRTDIFDITDRLGPALQREAVGEPVAIRNPARRLIGLALPQPDGRHFCIWFAGDEFRWGSAAELEDDYRPDGETPSLGGPLE